MISIPSHRRRPVKPKPPPSSLPPPPLPSGSALPAAFSHQLHHCRVCRVRHAVDSCNGPSCRLPASPSAAVAPGESAPLDQPPQLPFKTAKGLPAAGSPPPLTLCTDTPGKTARPWFNSHSRFPRKMLVDCHTAIPCPRSPPPAADGGQPGLPVAKRPLAFSPLPSSPPSADGGLPIYPLQSGLRPSSCSPPLPPLQMLNCSAYLLAAFQFSSTTNTAYFVVQLLTTSINLSPTYTVLVSGAGPTPMQSPPIACLRGRPHPQPASHLSSPPRPPPPPSV